MGVTKWTAVRPVVLVWLAVLGAVALPVRRVSAQPLTVMSENLYMGADPVPAFGSYVAGGRWAAVPAMTQFWNGVQATKFSQRADRIAQQIVANKPALVALQEVMQYWTGPADSLSTTAWWPDTPANQLELDFLQILLGKLAAKGHPYVAVAVTTEGEHELAGIVGGTLRDIRIVDRVAILARQDLLNSGMKISNKQGGPFATNFVSGPVTLRRGWNSVDVALGNKKFRFINMCLETPLLGWIQALQACELLFGPAATTLPVILAGDSNSNGNHNGSNALTYDLLTGWGGFQDAWSQVNPNDPGSTWGNDPDLKNPNALTYQFLWLGDFRMDLVLCRGPFQATAAKRVGILPSERTATGLWPSDHAGVVATINLK